MNLFCDMKKVVWIIIMIMSALSIQVKAQVSYGDITWGSYNMKINVITENDSVFLSIVYIDEKRKLVDEPKLLLKLMDDEVISLNGQLLGNISKSDGGVIISGFSLNPTTSSAKQNSPSQKIRLISSQRVLRNFV